MTNQPLTSEQAVDVVFTVTRDYINFVDEAALAEMDAATAAGLAIKGAIHGSIVLTSPAGARTEVVDELLPWVHRLCFGVIPDLVAGNPVEILYYSRSGRLSLRPSGDEIAVEGTHNDAQSYAADPLLVALVACGERFIERMRVVMADDANFIFNLDFMATDVAPAARAAVRDLA